VFTVEEHSVIGGLGGLVSELVASRLPGTRVTRIGLADSWSESAPNDFLLEKYGLSPKRVAEQVLAAARVPGPPLVARYERGLFDPDAALQATASRSIGNSGLPRMRP
jgi:hypothetical protein